MLRVAVLTITRHIMVAEKAMATGNREWHYHAVAALKIFNVSAYFFYNPHKLMAHHHWSRLWQGATINVKVGTANGGGSYFEDNVARLLDLRIINGITSNVSWRMKNCSLHRFDLF